MPKPKSQSESSGEIDLRIIGGTFRGRKIEYHGDPVTRPMKHRVREAMFNLVSTESKGRHAIDCFAGTGALGLEALSRGAASATFIEKHVPSSRVVKQNIATLEVVDRCELNVTSAFLWSKRDLEGLAAAVGNDENGLPRPWLVFVSPPYAFYVDRHEQMVELIEALMQRAPVDSTIVVEADQRFDFATLPEGVKQDKNSEGWDVRPYLPAVIGVWRKSQS